MDLYSVFLQGLEDQTHYREILASYLASGQKMQPVLNKLDQADYMKLLVAANAVIGDKLTPQDLSTLLEAASEIATTTAQAVTKIQASNQTGE